MTGAPVVVFSVGIFNKAINTLSGNNFGSVTSSTITTWCYKVSMKVFPVMGVTSVDVDDSNRDNVIDNYFLSRCIVCCDCQSR